MRDSNIARTTHIGAGGNKEIEFQIDLQVCFVTWLENKGLTSVYILTDKRNAHFQHIFHKNKKGWLCVRISNRIMINWHFITMKPLWQQASSKDVSSDWGGFITPSVCASVFGVFLWRKWLWTHGKLWSCYPLFKNIVLRFRFNTYY